MAANFDFNLIAVIIYDRDFMEGEGTVEMFTYIFNRKLNKNLTLLNART